MKKATLIMGRDGIVAYEEDFLAWVSYVTDRIDDATGLDVTVEVRGKSDVQTDHVSPRGGEEDETITNALIHLWESFCTDASAWPVRD